MTVINGVTHYIAFVLLIDVWIHFISVRWNTVPKTMYTYYHGINGEQYRGHFITVIKKALNNFG